MAAVKERPILFSAPMVRAILEGRKTQTRRVVKPQPRRERDAPSVTGPQPMWSLVGHGGHFAEHVIPGCAAQMLKCPYGFSGDRLWVRETWGFVNRDGYANCPSCLSYKADGRQRLVSVEDTMALPKTQLPNCGYSLNDMPKWRPSIHMPRWASRIDLEITDFRAERLQEISTADAMAEGIPQLAPEARHLGLLDDCTEGFAWDNKTSVENFAHLWDQINGAGAWDANPWVWVVEFRRTAAR